MTELVSKNLFEAAIGYRAGIDHERNERLIDKSITTTFAQPEPSPGETAFLFGEHQPRRLYHLAADPLRLFVELQTKGDRPAQSFLDQRPTQHAVGRRLQNR